MPSIISKLKKEITTFCPLCEKDYNPKNIQTVEQTTEAALIHTKCPKCQTAVLSLLYKDLIGINLIGMITDMDFNDVVKFKDADCIDEDNVLEAYQMIYPSTKAFDHHTKDGGVVVDEVGGLPR
ncbi:MAG: hypothetical protein ABIJ91_01230 [Candidatus Kuenenbacteria bacterium]